MNTAAFLVGLALVLGAGAVQAGGYYSPDFGVKRQGMFAVIGKPDDLTAIYHNPAALVLLHGTCFYHTQTWAFVDAGTRLYDSKGVLHPDHNIKPDWSVGISPFFGIMSDLGTERLRVALAVYAPNAYGAAMPEDEPSRYHVMQAYFVAARATTSLAYAITKKFSVAVNFNLLSVFLKATRMMNPLVLNDPDMRFADPAELEPFDAKLDMGGFDMTWAADIALYFQPTKRFRIGMLFAGGTLTELEGDVTLTYNDGKQEKSHQTTSLAIPFALQGGISWEFAPDFELGADVRFWHYQVNQEQLTILDDPIMGLKELREPKNNMNSWNFSVGLLHRLTPTIDVMIGAQRDLTAFPGKTVTMETPARDRTGVAMGVRWQASSKVRLGLSGSRNWFDMTDSQESVTTPPSNAKGFGSITQVAGEVLWKW